MKKIFTTLAKIIAAFCVSLGLWEIILRALLVTPIPFVQNSQFGWMPKPHSSGTFALEGRGWSRFNEQGFRGAPVEPRRKGQIRILCLGDSYTQGAQMDEEKTYPYLLQELLRKRALPKARERTRLVEPSNSSGASQAYVFNAGRDGTDLAYSVALAEPYKRLFQPDWTVVQLRDGWKELFNREQEIHYIPQGDGFRVVTRWHWFTMSRRMKQLIRWRVRDLAIFQYGKRHFTELRDGGIKVDKENETPAEPQSASSAASGTPPGAGPAPNVQIDGQQKRAIRWTVARLKTLYPRLILVHVPFGSPLLNSVVPVQAEEAVLVEECRRQGVTLIRMRTYFTQDAARHHQAPIGFANTLPWAGHPNARGHALIAQALYDHLVPELNQMPNPTPR